MGQNDTSTSLYKAGATVMLDACKTYFTSMERLRDMQRRTDAEFADAAADYVSKLKNADDAAQCFSWQQQACAEQIGRWNQYMLELIQLASDGQAKNQASIRNGFEQIQHACTVLITHLPSTPYAPSPAAADSTHLNARKHNSQRAGAT